MINEFNQRSISCNELEKEIKTSKTQEQDQNKAC